MISKNTINKGTIRTLIFKERGVWYGVALELNIVESGDDPRDVMHFLHEAIRGYLKSARKGKLSNSVINQKSDRQYERMWKITHARRKSIKSPYQIYSTGEVNLKYATQIV